MRLLFLAVAAWAAFRIIEENRQSGTPALLPAPRRAKVAPVRARSRIS
ncbi:hypothetical protein [Aquamicrobium sp. LC103]|nr:hypothetical protein [Aquamicrobium sp. LC103]